MSRNIQVNLLSPSSLALTPGGEAGVVQIAVERLGAGAEDYEVTVFVPGLAALPDWITWTPRRLVGLAPSQQPETVKITIAPTQEQPPAACQYTLDINVASVVDVNDRETVQLNLEVLPKCILDLALEETISDRPDEAYFTVTLNNLSNTRVSAALQAADADDKCTYEFDPPAPLELETGSQYVTRLRVRLKPDALYTTPTELGFRVVARLEADPAYTFETVGKCNFGGRLAKSNGYDWKLFALWVTVIVGAYIVAYILSFLMQGRDGICAGMACVVLSGALMVGVMWLVLRHRASQSAT